MTRIARCSFYGIIAWLLDVLLAFRFCGCLEAFLRDVIPPDPPVERCPHLGKRLIL